MRQSRFGMYVGPIYEPDIYLGTLPDTRNSDGTFMNVNMTRPRPGWQTSCGRYGRSNYGSAQKSSQQIMPSLGDISISKQGTGLGNGDFSISKQGTGLGNGDFTISRQGTGGPSSVNGYYAYKRADDRALYANSYYYNRNAYFYNGMN
jgi:hypothetical protein